MIRISSIDFFGRYSDSENKEYTIAWSDSDPQRGIGGHRDRGKGTYVLLQGEHILLQGKVERPNSCRVANNGTFIVNDWMFGDGLKGTFYSIDKSGTVLQKHRFKANLYNNGISPDGKYAVCQCANSDTTDGSVLAFFDLEARKILWKKEPETGWANSYCFDGENKIVILEYKEKGKFKYQFNGTLVDQTEWEKKKFEMASGFALAEMARRIIKENERDISEGKAKEALSLLREALKRDLDKYPNEKAKTYRSIGEVYELKGKVKEAIINYKTAIHLNPKVGVKQKLQKLEKSQA